MYIFFKCYIYVRRMMPFHSYLLCKRMICINRQAATKVKLLISSTLAKFTFLDSVKFGQKKCLRRTLLDRVQNRDTGLRRYI